MEEKNDGKSFQSLKESFRMTPPDDGWSRLDAELEKKQSVLYRQKANRFKRLSILLALLLISSISYYYFIIPVSTPAHLASAVAPKEQNIPSSVSQSDKKDLTNSDVNTNSSNLISSTNSGKEKVKQATVSNHQKLFSSIQSSSDKNASASVSTFHVDASANTSPTSLQRNGGLVTDSKTNSAINKGEATVTKSEKPELNSQPDNVQQSSGSNMSSTAENNSVTSADEGKKSATEEETQPTTALPIKANVLDTTSAMLPPKIANPASRWALSVFFSPNSTKNHLTDNSTAGVDYSSEYQSREKSRFSYGTGLMIKYNLSDHWSVSAGVIYSTMTYSISLPTIYAKTDANNEVHYEYPTSCGVVEMPNAYGSAPVYQGDSMKNAGCIQVVEFLNVPVVVRYELKKDRFTFFSEGGLSANFVLQEQANVTVANTETTVTNHITGLQNMNYGFLFGAGVEYKIFSGTGVFLEPVYKGSLSSLTRNTYVNCYPYSLGISGGLSFHF